MTLSLQFLNAREGDAIWIRWGQGHQMFVDLGTRRTGKDIFALVEQIPEAERGFELLVITHIDSDHIGGAMTALVEAEAVPGFKFKDVWFNGWPQLQQVAPREIEPMGVRDGQALGQWLEEHRWNHAFGGGPVAQGVASQTIHGLTLTVLGPTLTQLQALRDVWEDAVPIALAKEADEVPAGWEELGVKPPPTKPPLTDRESLETLAEPTALDLSETNASSIVLLLEYQDKDVKRTILLTGDGLGDSIATALARLPGTQPPAVDLVKLPHHGSDGNVTRALVRSVECPMWVVSSNGGKYWHPRAQAIARVIRYARLKRPHLIFNVPSTYSSWWRSRTWRSTFRYKSTYGTEEAGVTVTFDGNQVTVNA